MIKCKGKKKEASRKQRRTKFKTAVRKMKNIHWMPILGIIFIIIFPFILWVFRCICSSLIENNFSSLLSYYGVALGIFVSYLTYESKKEKREDERLKQLEPKISITETERIDEYAYTLTIKNYGIHAIRSLYIYGDFRFPVIETQQIVCLNIDCNPDGKNQYSFDNGYETIFVESDKFENDIMCTDEDGNIWSCDFDRESGYKKWIYLPSEFHLM